MFLILAMSAFMAFLELSGLVPVLRTEAGKGLSYPPVRKKSRVVPCGAAVRAWPAFPKKYIRLRVLSISEDLTAGGLWALIVSNHL
jgi:hypothetical protein